MMRFARAFDVAFDGNVKPAPFRQDKISHGFMIGSSDDTAKLPKFSLASSPHVDSQVSLGPMEKRLFSFLGANGDSYCGLR